MAPEKFVCLEAPNASPSHGLSQHHARRSSGPMVSAAMDDFVLRVYLPQLQEKVTEVFLHCVNGRCHLHPDLGQVYSD